MDTFGGLRCVAGLAYRDTGLTVAGVPCDASTSRPLLVLVHGGAGSRNHWVGNIDKLARRFRVLSVDLPGFGESARPPVGISAADYADWFGVSLRTVLNAVRDSAPQTSQAAPRQGRKQALQDARREVPPFHLAAFSFGAVTSCMALARGAPMPRALTLIAPGGFGAPRARSVRLLPMPKRGEASEAEIRAVVAANLGSWMLAVPPPPDDPLVTLQLRNIARTRFDSRSMSLGTSLLDDLPRIGAPLQVIWGSNDSLADPSVDSRVAAVRAMRPDAHLNVVEGAGHWTQYDAAEAVNRALADFHA